MFDIKYLLRCTATSVFALTLLTPSSSFATYKECKSYGYNVCWPDPPKCGPREQTAIVDNKAVIYELWQTKTYYHSRTVVYTYVVNVPVVPFGMVGAGYAVCSVRLR
jgi:hypothetical protein